MISAVTRFPSIAADTPALSGSTTGFFRLRSVIDFHVQSASGPIQHLHIGKRMGAACCACHIHRDRLSADGQFKIRGNHDSLGDTGVVIQPVFVFPHLQEGIVQSMVRVPDAMDGGAVRPPIAPAPFQDGYGTPSNASSAPPSEDRLQASHTVSSCFPLFLNMDGVTARPASRPGREDPRPIIQPFPPGYNRHSPLKRTKASGIRLVRARRPDTSSRNGDKPVKIGSGDCKSVMAL